MRADKRTKVQKIFPTVLVVLDVCAALVYAYGGDVRHTVYWLAAALLTACVTYWKGEKMDEWNRCLRRIWNCLRHKLYLLFNPWSTKLVRISNTWSKFNYQMEGRGEKHILASKVYKSMDERLRNSIKRSLDKRRISGWRQRLGIIRTGWRDRSRRLKGGTFSWRKKSQ